MFGTSRNLDWLFGSDSASDSGKGWSANARPRAAMESARSITRPAKGNPVLPDRFLRNRRLPRIRSRCYVGRMSRRFILPALGLMAAFASPLRAEEIMVFAAASLQTALDSIAADWQAQTGDAVVIAYAGSPVLARQIEQGAPADIYVSASPEWMDALQSAGFIRADSRRDLVGNVLVLVGYGAGLAPVSIGQDLDLAALLAGGKLSMGLLDSVPAGQYGKAALENLGLWPSVAASVVQSDNVRAALALVALGEATLGIVYASDARADDLAGDLVTTLGAFPAASHPPIRYPAALTAQSTKAAAASFLDHLSSDAAQAVFKAQGFTLLK